MSKEICQINYDPISSKHLNEACCLYEHLLDDEHLIYIYQPGLTPLHAVVT